MHAWHILSSDLLNMLDGSCINSSYHCMKSIFLLKRTKTLSSDETVLLSWSEREIYLHTCVLENQCGKSAICEEKKYFKSVTEILHWRFLMLRINIYLRILCVLSSKTNKQHLILHYLFILYLWSGRVSIVKYRPLRDLNIFNQRFIIYKNRLGS